MRKTLRGTGWSLMAAGSLSLVGPVSAQGTAAPANSGRSSVLLATHGSRPAALSEAEQFLDQVNVELAWMADPITFPYSLAAYCVGDAMQVRGYVPTDVVRQHALRIARQHARMPVWDDIRVHPSSVRHEAPDSIESLERSASDLLSAMDPPHINGLAVKAQSDGRITVSGSIHSYEEKLAVSRALRRLHCCTSVQNDLAVSALRRDGHSFTPVDQQGQLLLPAAGAPAQRASTAAVAPSVNEHVTPPMEPVTHSTPEPVSVQAVPSARSPATKALTLPDKGDLTKTMNIPYPVLRKEAVAHYEATVPATLPDISPAPSATTSTRTSPSEVRLPVGPPPAKPLVIQPWTADDVPAVSEKPSTSGTRPAGTTPATMTLDPGLAHPLPSAPKSAAPPPTETSKRQESYSQPYLQPTLPVVTSPRSMSDGSHSTAAAASKAGPVSAPVQPMGKTPPDTGYVTTGTITLSDEGVSTPAANVPRLVPKPVAPTVAASPTPAVSQPKEVAKGQPPAPIEPVPLKPAASQPKLPSPVGWPYQTTGSIILAKEEPPAKLAAQPPRQLEVRRAPVQPAAAPAAQPAKLPELERAPKVASATPLQQRVTQRVEAVCAGRGRDVRVVIRPDSTWEISLKAASAQDARELWTKIQDLPELAPFKVSLKVQVEP
jgi:hypothetical protein